MHTDDLINFVVAILIGSLTAYLAKGRGRSAAIWFFIGMLFGIFGLIALFFFPAIRISSDLPVRSPPKLSEDMASPTKPQEIEVEKQWFFLDSAHVQHGPFLFSEIEALWKEGKVGPATYLWCQEMLEWKKLQDLPTVQSHLLETRAKITGSAGSPTAAG